jgi:SAM-dependent methyltransferase
MLDEPYIPEKILIQNLKELDFINRILGGHKISLSGIEKLVTDKNKQYHLVDLGCGSGDFMKFAAQWARKSGYQMRFTGVDKNPDAIRFLEKHCKDYPEISGVASDYKDFLKSNGSVDIVHSSLFCHHLNDEELAGLLDYMKNQLNTGFVINDLHRHWISYYGVYLITHLLKGSVLSKNDGPVSVLRAFKGSEFHTFLQKAGIKDYSLNWKWAFRYLVVGKSDSNPKHGKFV